MSQEGQYSKFDFLTKIHMKNLVSECHREFFIVVSFTRTCSFIKINSIVILTKFSNKIHAQIWDSCSYKHRRIQTDPILLCFLHVSLPTYFMPLGRDI